MCGVKFSSPEELMAHVKSEHGIEINQDFMNNLTKGLGEFFEKLMSGNVGIPTETEGSKENDPTSLFGNMMEQLFKGLTQSMQGLQNESSDSSGQDMPNPFADMMKTMFSQSFSPESETDPVPEKDVSPTTTNEDDISFQENSIEIPFATDDVVTDDDEKKKGQKGKRQSQ